MAPKRAPRREAARIFTALICAVGMGCGGEAPEAAGGPGAGLEDEGEGGAETRGPGLFAPREPAPLVGEAAPDFALPVLLDQEGLPAPGDTLRLSDLRGRVVLVDFWNTGCPPCVFEHATLIQLAEEYRSRGVRFLGVTDRDSPEALQRFQEEYGRFPYPNLADRGGAVGRSYRIPGWPTKAVVDREGRVAWWAPGGPLRKAVLADVLEAVLAGRRPAPVTSAPYLEP